MTYKGKKIKIVKIMNVLCQRVSSGITDKRAHICFCKVLKIAAVLGKNVLS